MNYDKNYLKEINNWNKKDSNHSFLSRHPELERFDMPKTFYFRYLPERHAMHWAIIVKMDDSYCPPVSVYFINDWGRVFDKLKFKNIKIARRRLRRNGFDFSTNRYCPFTPPEPIYIQLSEGKKSAPYSKGNLWKSVQRDKKHIDKIEKTYIKERIEYYKRFSNWVYQEKVGVPVNVAQFTTKNNSSTAYSIHPSEEKAAKDLTQTESIAQNPIHKPNIKKCLNIAIIISIILLLFVTIITLLVS